MQVIHSFSLSVHLQPFGTRVLSSNTHTETNIYKWAHIHWKKRRSIISDRETLYHHRWGSRNQGVCADLLKGSWEEGSPDEYTSTSNPKHTHKRHHSISKHKTLQNNSGFRYLAVTGETRIVSSQHFITDQCSCTVTEGLWNTNHKI